MELSQEFIVVSLVALCLGVSIWISIRNVIIRSSPDGHWQELCRQKPVRRPSFWQSSLWPAARGSMQCGCQYLKQQRPLHTRTGRASCLCCSSLALVLQCPSWNWIPSAHCSAVSFPSKSRSSSQTFTKIKPLCRTLALSRSGKAKLHTQPDFFHALRHSPRPNQPGRQRSTLHFRIAFGDDENKQTERSAAQLRLSAACNYHIMCLKQGFLLQPRQAGFSVLDDLCSDASVIKK